MSSCWTFEEARHAQLRLRWPRVINTQTAWVRKAQASVRKRASSERVLNKVSVLNKVFSGAKQQVKTGHQPLPDTTTLNRNSDKLQPTVVTNTIHALDSRLLRSPPRGQAVLEAAILLPSYMVFSQVHPTYNCLYSHTMENPSSSITAFLKHTKCPPLATS